jgi:hypothetical protein
MNCEELNVMKKYAALLFMIVICSYITTFRVTRYETAVNDKKALLWHWFCEMYESHCIPVLR